MQTTFKLLFSCLFCFALVLLSGCGGGGGLRGTYQLDNSNSWENRGEAELKFSGRAFTLTMRPVQVQTPIGSYWDGPISFRPYSLNAESVVIKGTYSLSDDKKKIELKHSDGEISIHSFDSTKNTITIDRDQFTRK